MAPIISALSGLYQSLLYTSSGFSATGGTIDEDNNVAGYTIHLFDTVGPMDFTVQSGEALIDLVLVGAGGGGGWNWGAGGGSGGVVVARDLPVGPGPHAITIGGHPGTRATPGSTSIGNNGNPTTFVHPSGTFTALGGGGGGGQSGTAANGGSGGGAGNGGTSGQGLQPGQPQPTAAGIVSNYGTPGAGTTANVPITGYTSDCFGTNAGFGGGGAGQPGRRAAGGSHPSTTYIGGPGGHGVYIGGLFSDFYGDSGYVAGGGGGRGSGDSPGGPAGGGFTPNKGGYGGQGGGGDNYANFGTNPSDAFAYGGGGAGNTSSDNVSGLGYKGAVVVRYKTVQTDINYTAATGGDHVFTKGDYKWHVYTTTGNGTFNVSTLGDDKTIDILVVAGGGGGTHPYGAGAGGGGVIFREGHPITSTGAYSLKVGAGGVSAQGPGGNAPGNPSTFLTQNTSSPYPADSLVALGGGRGANQTGTTPAPGGSGGGADGVPTSTSEGGYGLNGGWDGPGPSFLPNASRFSGHGMPGGNAQPGNQTYGAGGGGAWGLDVQRGNGPGNSVGGMGFIAPDGFLPQPFAPWMPGKTQFMGMPIPGNALGLRMFGAGGHGGPSTASPNRNFGGGGINGQSPTGETPSNGVVTSSTDPGSGLNGRGGGGGGTNSGENTGPGSGGTGCIIIKYRYQ